MGTWGYGIFEDDFTMDIKDYYIEFRREGVSVNQRIARIERLYSDILNDKEAGADLVPLFYIGLAGALLESHHLVEAVKEQAIRQIAEGNGLNRWKEAGFLPLFRRSRSLRHFKKQLLKAVCITDDSEINREDLNADKFAPENQKYSVYELTFASGNKLIGNTAHYERRMKYFEDHPLK